MRCHNKHPLVPGRSNAGKVDTLMRICDVCQVAAALLKRHPNATQRASLAHLMRLYSVSIAPL